MSNLHQTRPERLLEAHRKALGAEMDFDETPTPANAFAAVRHAYEATELTPLPGDVEHTNVLLRILEKTKIVRFGALNIPPKGAAPDDVMTVHIACDTLLQVMDAASYRADMLRIDHKTPSTDGEPSLWDILTTLRDMMTDAQGKRWRMQRK